MASRYNDARGIVLPVILMLMAVLGLLGMTFLTTSLTESRVASNETNMMRALNIAETGLERAKARVKNGPEASLNNFLPGPPSPPGGNPGPQLYDNMNFADGSYSVVIVDDVDTGNNPNVDTNNRVFIQSTGTLGTAQKQIRALIEKQPLGPLGTPRGAAEIVTTAGSSWELGADKGGSYDGRDWNAPADMAGCANIAGCGTLTANPATYGAFTNHGSGSIDVAEGNANHGTMVGTDCLDPAAACAQSQSMPDPTSSYQYDTTVLSTRWDTTIAQLKAKAAPADILTGAALSSNTTHTWGTPAAPKIMVINDTTTIDWQAKVNGAGVLIIESTSGDFKFQGSGELNWQGLVFVRSLAGGQFELENASGRIRVFGQVVNASIGSPQIEINGSDKNFIKYSSASMNLARGLLGGGFAVLSWQEVAIQ